MHRAVAFEGGPLRCEAGGQLVPVHRIRTFLEQREQAVAMFEARPVAIGEAHPQLSFQRGDPFRDTECSDEAVPLLGGQRRDHEAHSVAAAEVAAKCAPDGIAQPFAIAAAIEHLGHRTAIGHGTDRDIAQWHADLATLAGGIAVAQGGEQREGAIGAGDEIPCGQHLVDRRRGRHVPVFRSAHQRITAGGIDGEIHCLAPVVPAHDTHADQFGRAFGLLGRDGVVTEEALLGQIRDEIARIGRQRDQQFAAFVAAQVERDRFLRAVEILPAQAAALLGQHVAVVVEPARLVIDADHLGAQLRAVEARGGRGDEARGFDDAQSVKKLVHPYIPAAYSRSMCLAICSWRICVVPS